MTDSGDDIDALVRAWRDHAASDGPGDAFAVRLARTWLAIRRDMASDDPTPAASGSSAACEDLFDAWLLAEQIPWRSRVALIETGAHDWAATMRAVAATASIPASRHDPRETTWSALLDTAPDTLALDGAVEAVARGVDAKQLGSRLFSIAAERYAALGAVARAVEVGRRVVWPEVRARTLEALAPFLDEATLRAEVDTAWAAANDPPMLAEHYRLSGYDRLLRLHPVPRSRLPDLEAFVATLSEGDREVCPDHEDARAILADAWERAGDLERASHWRAQVPPAESEPPLASTAPPDPEDPWDLARLVPSLQIDELPAVLARAVDGAGAALFRDRAEWSEVLAAVADRDDLPPELETRARETLAAHWELEDDLPAWLVGDARRALLLRAVRRRRGQSWRGSDRDRGPRRREEIAARGGDAALRAWAVVDALDED